MVHELLHMASVSSLFGANKKLIVSRLMLVYSSLISLSAFTGYNRTIYRHLKLQSSPFCVFTMLSREIIIVKQSALKVWASQEMSLSLRSRKAP